MIPSFYNFPTFFSIGTRDTNIINLLKINIYIYIYQESINF